VPLYEYQCARCGRFELIQRFADAPLTTCPTCNGEVQKLLSAPAIQFKGSGWYVTDYARKSDGGGGKSEKKGEGKSDGKSDGTKADGAAGESANAGSSGTSEGGDGGSTKKPGKSSTKAAAA